MSPFSKKGTNLGRRSTDVSELNLYDQIEKIISIKDIQFSKKEILSRFYALNKIQQQLTFVTLIEHNMVEIIGVILSSEFEINYLLRGRTPLHFAIKDHNIAIIKMLINYDADIEEVQDKNKETAFKCSVRTGNPDIIKYLIEHGSDINTEEEGSRAELVKH